MRSCTTGSDVLKESSLVSIGRAEAQTRNGFERLVTDVGSEYNRVSKGTFPKARGEREERTGNGSWFEGVWNICTMGPVAICHFLFSGTPFWEGGCERVSLRAWGGPFRRVDRPAAGPAACGQVVRRSGAEPCCIEPPVDGLVPCRALSKRCICPEVGSATAGSHWKAKARWLDRKGPVMMGGEGLTGRAKTCRRRPHLW